LEKHKIATFFISCELLQFSHELFCVPCNVFNCGNFVFLSNAKHVVSNANMLLSALFISIAN